MRRQTHLAVGALCALPIAVDLAPAAAAGVVVSGLAGAVVPDYLDLRSDFQTMLKHRGASHSVIVGVLATFVVFLIAGALSRVDSETIRMPEALVKPVWIAFAAGLTSHLALDACTPGGVRPGLPVIGRKVWLLPRAMRIRTGSSLDALIGWTAGLAVVGVGFARIAGVMP